MTDLTEEFIKENKELEQRNFGLHKLISELNKENKRLKHDVGNLGYKIKNQRKEIERQIAQNAQLKELLKKCSYKINWRTKTGNKPSDEEKQKLFDEISQVLGDK